MTRQLHRIAVGGKLRGRVQLATNQREVAALVTVANHVLTRASSAAPEPKYAPAAPLAALADQLHEAVLIHGNVGILYANPQFAALIGAQPAELVGRKLEDLVAPEYAQLVGEHIRHRLNDEPAAPRYEVDLLGLQGQLARLELNAWPIMHEGQRALLVLGVEVMPTQTVAALAMPGGMRSRARAALMSMPGAVATLNARGRVEYLNPAAAAMLGVQGDPPADMPPEQLVSNANEADQKLLAELVQQALTAGSPINLGRRPIGLGQGVNERLVEVTVAPIRDDAGDLDGAVISFMASQRPFGPRAGRRATTGGGAARRRPYRRSPSRGRRGRRVPAGDRRRAS